MPRLLADGRADPGVKRQSNEDTWIGPPSPLSPEQAAAKGYLYIVADGVGGHQGGAIASKMAAQITRQVYYADTNPDIQASLVAAIQEANRQIYHRGISNPNEHGMSTTLTAAVVRGNELVVANVGDSRAYLIKSGQPQLLTIDHTWVEEKRREGLLTDTEAANHPQRNVITRSLGGNLHVDVDVFPPQPLAPGDHVLLCSDGLSDIATAQEMAAIVGQSRHPTRAVQQLVELACKRGAPDNVTAVVISLAGGRASDSSVILDNALPLVGILGVMAILVLVAFLVKGGSLRLPTFGQRATRTPAATVTAEPSPSPLPTAAPTVPLAALELLEPAEGARFYLDQSISFSWAWQGLESDQRFVLEVSEGARVVLSDTVRGVHYTLPASSLGRGEYTWTVWVEREIEGEWERLVSGEQRSLRVVPRPTATPTETPTVMATPMPTAVGTSPLPPPPPYQPPPDR